MRGGAELRRSGCENLIKVPLVRKREASFRRDLLSIAILRLAPRMMPLGCAGGCQMSLTEVVLTSGKRIPTGGPGTVRDKEPAVGKTKVFNFIQKDTVIYTDIGME